MRLAASTSVTKIFDAFGNPISSTPVTGEPGEHALDVALFDGYGNPIGSSGGNLDVALPPGASTSANQATANTYLADLVAALTNPLPVSGTFWQATQPVSAASLPLPTGAATSANQTNGTQTTQISQGGNTASVLAGGTAASGTNNPLVVAPHPLSALPTGTNTLGNLNTNNDRSGSGSISSSAGTIVATTNGCSAVIFNVSGTWSTPAMVFEGTTDGSTWQAISGYPVNGAVTEVFTANGQYIVPCAGYQQIRLFPFGWTSGTLNATWNASSGAFASPGSVAYNATLPSLPTATRTDFQTNKFGELATRSRNKYLNITGNATTTVKSGAGVLSALIFGDVSAASTITIYDNTAGSGTVIATISPSAASLSGGSITFNCEFSTGLTIVTAGLAANNISVTYQ